MGKQVKSYFFNAGASKNSKGKRINFKGEGQPSESLFGEQFDSMLMFAETDDRAKQYTGAEADLDLVGHVQIETDVNAKNNVNGIQASTTKVVHAGQLPTVDATDTQAITGTDPFSGVVLDATADGTSTRNNYLIKFSTSFLSWLQALKDKVYTHDSSISANTSGVSTNAGNISTNAGLISTNTSNIGTNTSGVATNAGNIGTNATNIGTNVTNIGNNTSNVSTNTSDIGTNTTNIGTNTTNIGNNATAIITLQGQVATYKITELPLPVWNMDTTVSENVTHGLSATEFRTISNVSVTIFNDTPGSNVYPLDTFAGAGVTQGGISSISSSIIIMNRLTGGTFDDPAFSTLATSRGFIRFTYIPD